MGVYERVKEILKDEFGISETEISPAGKLDDDLFMDFLDRVELTMAIEDDFGVYIDDETAEKFVTVEDIVKFLEGGEKNAADRH